MRKCVYIQKKRRGRKGDRLREDRERYDEESEVGEEGERGRGEGKCKVLVNEGAGERVSWFCDAAATEGVNFPKRSSVI
jgi:hypothetical protein